MDGDGAFVCVFHGDVLFVGDECSLIVVKFDHVDVAEETDGGGG